ATLNLCNVTPAPLAFIPDTKWRFDIWQH
ncbi:MAG: hypothetical protein JWN15_2124, partial [Firmicutes bacterium]|nr:hypothetical protein [Bacillota bacterium]